MEEAKLKILKMLEEGKITADEAVRLLEALEKEGRSAKDTERAAKSYKKSLFGFGEFMDGLMEMLREVLSASLGSIPTAIAAGLKGDLEKIEETIPLENVEELEINLQAGDFDITGTEQDEFIRVCGEGVLSYEIQTENKTMVVNVSVGDADIEIPRNIPVKVKLGAGDLNFINAPSVTTIKVSGGDADIKFNKIENVFVEVLGGDMDIYVPKDADFTLEATIKWGDMSLPDGVSLQRKQGIKIAKFGTGEGGKMNVKVAYGDLDIKFIEQ